LDELDPIQAAAAQVASGLGRVELAALPPRVQGLIIGAVGSANELARSVALKPARLHYGALSEALLALAQFDPRLQRGWHVFRCPMAEGFQKWFQPYAQIENPYMGQYMLACGSVDEWADVKEAEAAPEHSPDEVAYYTCPMHPSVRQHTAGACPICNMDLTPVTKEDQRTGEILVDAVRRQRIGVRTEVAQTRTLSRSIRVVGEVAWDESRVHDVTARVDGWVEDVRVSRTGDPVARGATLLHFYSPDLLATQRDLLAAPTGSRFAETARERLSLWGMSRHAIDRLVRSQEAQKRVAIRSPISGVVVEKHVNEGAHIVPGALLYRVADTRHLWVEAQVFEQDLPHIAVGQPVQIALPHAPARQRTGVVAYIYPTLESGVRTAKVRVELDNTDGVLRPGMLADLRFDVALGAHLAVPIEAVIYTGTRRLVFVDQGEGRLRPEEIQIGARAGDWVIVRKGLSEGDVVVRSGAFLLAAESRIRSATTYWEADHGAH
jgi:Cu(I)/Ag(I) efflux system membrane fusion protein